MSDFKLHFSAWTENDFLKASQDAKLLYLFLTDHPELTESDQYDVMNKVFKCWDAKRFKDAFIELFKHDLIGNRGPTKIE